MPFSFPFSSCFSHLPVPLSFFQISSITHLLVVRFVLRYFLIVFPFDLLSLLGLPTPFTLALAHSLCLSSRVCVHALMRGVCVLVGEEEGRAIGLQFICCIR